MSDFQKYLDLLKSNLTGVEDESFKWSDVIGLLIIQLKNTDSLNKERNESNATQIQLTDGKDTEAGKSKTEDFFPTLTLNTSFKSWRVSISARLNRDNIIYLGGEPSDEKWIKDTIQIRRRILNVDEQGKGNPTLQICYGNDLMPLREQLEVDDYLVIVKKKDNSVYEAFGIKKDIDLGSGKKMYLADQVSNDSSVYDYNAIVKYERDIKDYSVDELGDILKDMYDNAEDSYKVAAIHLFGIKYGKYITEKSFTSKAIVKAAGINESYTTEVQKGIKIYESLSSNKFGISIQDDNGLILRPEPQGVRRTGGENILLYGVPGSGKSRYIKDNYPADEKYKERVVFHPDYTYSDFVGQILPRVKGKNLEYEFTPGPFTKILRKAYEDPENSYYLIIEEINRGNAPAIFGEIFQLLDRKNDDADDPTKIGESEYEITNADVAREVYGDENRKVGIPSNLWILATMNTSDQNVFTLDTAFQRRWHMQQIPNIFKEDHAFADTPIMDTSVTWRAFNETINDIIITKNPMSSTEDKRLGTYFIKAQDLQADSKAFPEKVIKYLWDDAVKFSRDTIFRDKDYPSLELVIEHFEKSSADERLRVFRDGLFKLKDQEEAKSDDNDNSNGDKQDQ